MSAVSAALAYHSLGLGNTIVSTVCSSKDLLQLRGLKLTGLALLAMGVDTVKT